MIEIRGKRNSAIIYAEKIDNSTKTQIASLIREEAYSDSKIRIMPDTHSGKSVAVGTTMTVAQRINPALVGVDIGCGMEVVILNQAQVDLEALDGIIHNNVPCGAKTHGQAVASFDLNGLACKDAVDKERALRSLGTLGGGNHFIELDKSESGELILVIHSGSRQLGSDVAKYYQDQAYRYQCKKLSRRSKHSVRSSEEYFCKAEKRERKSEIRLRYEDAILEGELFERYLHDISVVTEFAEHNRRTIAQIICDGMGLTVKERFSCIHNYIDQEHMILRKGAISARLNERVIIPLNMRDGAILGRGLGNPDWNFSAPHGAGRVCNRTDAKYTFSVGEYQEQMKGIYTTTAQLGSLDECPMAYKPPEAILSQIGETVAVEQIIKPIYNFKSC